MSVFDDDCEPRYSYIYDEVEELDREVKYLRTEVSELKLRLSYHKKEEMKWRGIAVDARHSVNALLNAISCWRDPENERTKQVYDFIRSIESKLKG